MRVKWKISGRAVLDCVVLRREACGMARPEQFYWDAISSLDVHDGGEDLTLAVKTYRVVGGQRVWDNDHFATSLRPVWPVLVQFLEVLGGQKALVLSRTRVKADEEVARLNPGMSEEEARRIVVKTERVAPRIWNGFHCSIELTEGREIQDGVLDVRVYLYSDARTKEQDRRVSGEKKLALAALIPELTKPVVALFEVLAGAQEPIVQLYGPEWHDQEGHWYGTDHCSLQAVWHDEERSMPDGPPNLIPFPRKG